ncbi:hypothetical protein DFR50_14251 [Roseiarcus fermentans]|uniref:Uncharacterized protein n=1 Tax=Roseiarcus fermentans TaxID=1473586 RepID=A0A366EN23_9HYPH|nr:hypothetical protein [Roseiarcus fermentans]RBP03803.1 hypothetical protein DFR50_14251 [Roseiarcus fermentans]
MAAANNSTSSTRRSIGLTASLPFLSAAPGPEPVADHSPDFAVLRTLFDEAIAVERATPVASRDAALNRTRAIVDRILATKSETLEDLRLKALAVAWCRDFEPVTLASFDHDMSLDLRLAVSIVSDLLLI